MAKFKPGDKVVLEIKDMEMLGPIENVYNTTCGIRIKVAELDKAELLKEQKADKAPAKKSTKKAAKKE